MDNDLLRILGAVVAVVASGVGIAVAVDQLTLRSRMRRTETWSRDAATGESQENRLTALADIRIRATSEIVGSHLVPTRVFLEGIVWSAAIPLLLLQNLHGSKETGGVIVFGGFCFVTLWLVYRRTIRLYLERQRVVRAYIAGEAVPKPALGMLAQMEGGTLLEFSLGALGSAGLCVVGVAIGWYSNDHGAVEPVLLSMAGIVMVLIAIRLVRQQAERGL